MSFVHAIPLLLSVLLGLVLGLVVWGLMRSRQEPGNALEMRNDVLVGLLTLAAFALGVFLTYILMGPRF